MDGAQETLAPTDLLSRYFASDDAEAAEALGMVIDGKVLGTIRATVQRRMYASGEAEREDVCSEAVTMLIRRLSRFIACERSESGFLICWPSSRMA